MHAQSYVHLASRFFGSKAPQTTPPPAVSPGAAHEPGQINPFHLPPVQAYSAWPLGIPLSVHVHLSTDPTGNIFAKSEENAKLPHFVWENITFGDWNEARTIEYNVDLPEVSNSDADILQHFATHLEPSLYNTMARCGQISSWSGIVRIWTLSNQTSIRTPCIMPGNV